uniref:Capsid protein n=1 Tax=Chimpanzee anellovirus TaxID=1743410 RepID=A0A0S2GME3_9VIRU|nr:ORF1 [Chimpanzee anellovirus]
MPYYWRRQRPWRRRRRLWTRRTRGPFRRWPYRRYRRTYNIYRVRRRRYPCKLKTITLKQFQPRSIRRCNIIGNICLFQGSPERANNNYIQSIYSYVPVDEPGGGGWTLMIETLSSLWGDFEHLKNIWTASNEGLPLVRYGGVILHFYQSAYTDYIVEVSNCYPMVDTKYTQADAAPSRMLLKRNTIRVPSSETKKRRKPYKRIRVPPPAQMQNKWYFQKDICNIPLLMITATAVDFRYPFCASSCRSNNLTLTCLNTELFQIHSFDSIPATTGYTPKPNTYLYHKNPENPESLEHLIFLGTTKTNTAGKEGNINKPENWGNPFYHEYIDGTKKVYSSNLAPTAVKKENITQITELVQNYFFKVRYNPEKDTGAANKIYIVSNFAHQGWDPPQNPNIIMDGFPLYDMCWGIIDWWTKTQEVLDINHHYIFCIQTDMFSEKREFMYQLTHTS